ncbi:hypothetical protein KVV02_000067 [Mortierella alpina]|uniref:G-protein coupled receptors family 2 profile 2 domain-containing protein n=1 Tax=Mortierella alpina TaxID=64518 RepID=A0A9P8A0I3_MORAP|nr:hypothetical protein KVV02_000067 [Mortierella alpina]
MVPGMEFCSFRSRSFCFFSLSTLFVLISTPFGSSAPAHNNSLVILPSSSPLDTGKQHEVTCPPPLILNTLNVTSDWCMGPCCLPCPAEAVFYKPNTLETVYTIASTMYTFSAVACALLAMCYSILPSRRRHPQSIILWFAALMALVSGISSAWLYKGPELICKTRHEIATMASSWFCGLQGILIMYTWLVMLCLGLLLIANLHLLAVYRSSLIQKNLTALFAVSFALPLTAVVPVAMRQQIRYPDFAFTCFVDPEVLDSYFYNPFTVVATLALLFHLGTIGYMIKVKSNTASPTADLRSFSRIPSRSSDFLTTRRRSLKATLDVAHLLKQQWRPGMFALLLFAIHISDRLYYRIEGEKLAGVASKAWYQDWISCLHDQAVIASRSGSSSTASGHGSAAQAACASIARPNVPSARWIVVNHITLASTGAIFALIFLCRTELWHDLRIRSQRMKEAAECNCSIMMKESGQLDHQHRPECHGNQDRAAPQGKGACDDVYSDLHGDDVTPYVEDIPTPPPNVACRPAIDNGRPVARVPVVGALSNPPRTSAAVGLRSRETEETWINIFSNCERIYYLYPDTSKD